MIKIKYIDPIPKPRMVYSDKYKKRPIVSRYWNYKDNLKDFLDIKDIENIKKFGLDIVFIMPFPLSWSKKKKDEYNNMAHQKRPDIDNLAKAFLDCVMDEDSAVWNIKAKKIWSEKGKIIINIKEQYGLQDN